MTAQLFENSGVVQLQHIFLPSDPCGGAERRRNRHEDAGGLSALREPGRYAQRFFEGRTAVWV
jgi:hypothetical protein